MYINIYILYYYTYIKVINKLESALIVTLNNLNGLNIYEEKIHRNIMNIALKILME